VREFDTPSGPQDCALHFEEAPLSGLVGLGKTVARIGHREAAVAPR